MDKKRIKIEGNRIYMKILNENDATSQYCSWINDKEVNKYLESKKATIEELKKYIKTRLKDPNSLFFGIFLRKNDLHIGNVKLEPINFKNGIATLGILIGEKIIWSKGYGTEALNNIIEYAFKVLNLGEINLGVLKNNIGAIKAYEKAGFKKYDENKSGYKMKILNPSFKT
jgi:RimJ/RimL family protein N-acetyltransferase